MTRRANSGTAASTAAKAVQDTVKLNNENWLKPSSSRSASKRARTSSSGLSSSFLFSCGRSWWLWFEFDVRKGE
ncbi:hypothetical protein VNO78_28473 [Psophocarpus tetragonolobus]|uniref:Uncharacterized protein n=1 Tax=Psophocarpus tetragonolobus TaxID=3891 RepID=A0AAN9S4Q3_PSOTE